MSREKPEQTSPLNNRPEEEEEEWVPEDDTIIGKAFRWSLLVIGLIGIVVLSAVYGLRPGAPAEVIRDDIKTQVPKTYENQIAMPGVTFTDITKQAGIDFVHNNGALGEKLLPETMGSGAAFFDYDNDGDSDLFLVNSQDWPHSKRHRETPMALYQNDGTGRFVDVTRAAGLLHTFYGVGVATADYDGDGWIDLFITALGPNHLYRNQHGRFVEVTDSAGVAGDPREWSTSAGFFDADGDNDLDLFVCNYVRWSREIDLEINFTLNGRDRAYGPPTHFTGTYPYFYRNNGDGTFTDASAESGIHIDNPATGKPMSKGLALLPIDLDRDGFLDVLLANDTVQNFLFHNKGNGTFEELGALSGVGFDSHGAATGAMGIDAAYFRNSDALAVGIGNFANQMTSLLVSEQDPLLFNDEASTEGVGSASRLKLSFGLFFFDYDLDGRQDLFQANGHLEEEINQVQASQFYEQSAQLFWNAGGSKGPAFEEVPPKTLGDLARPLVGRGATYADIDDDGDLDVLVTQAGRSPVLFRNDQKLGHHWLRVRVQGKSPNHSAIGARVELTAGGITQRRLIMPTRSYLSQVELPATFGLGELDKIEDLRVIWPDGASLDVTPLPEVNQTLTIRPQ